MIWKKSLISFIASGYRGKHIVNIISVVVDGNVTVLTERNPPLPNGNVLALTYMLESKTEIFLQHFADIPPVKGLNHIDNLYLAFVDNEIKGLHPEFIDNGSCGLSVRRLTDHADACDFLASGLHEKRVLAAYYRVAYRLLGTTGQHAEQNQKVNQ